jgi:hypothetical protein
LLALKYPSQKQRIGGSLAVLGVIEFFGLLPFGFAEATVMGLATLIVGLWLAAAFSWTGLQVQGAKRSKATVVAVSLMVLGILCVGVGMMGGIMFSIIFGYTGLMVGAILGAIVLTFLAKAKPENAAKTQTKLNKKLVIGLILIILMSTSVMILRQTNVIHEQHLENWSVSTTNFEFQGTVQEIKLNYEVNTGYSYHIFKAYLIVQVSNVSATDSHLSSMWNNVTEANEYWQNKTIIVGYDKTDPPQLSVGQQIEVNGYFCGWIEDSLYSGMLIITANMDEGYIRPL